LLRIFLEVETPLEKFNEYIKPLNAIGCTYEGFKERQYALDVPSDTSISKYF